MTSMRPHSATAVSSSKAVEMVARGQLPAWLLALRKNYKFIELFAIFIYFEIENKLCAALSDCGDGGATVMGSVMLSMLNFNVNCAALPDIVGVGGNCNDKCAAQLFLLTAYCTCAPNIMYNNC